MRCIICKFFPFRSCLSILLIVFFVVQKLFSVMQYHLFVFAFIAFAFNVQPQNSLPRIVQRSFLYCMRQESFLCFSVGCPIFLSLYIEETIFFHIVQSYLLCCKLIGHKWVSLFLIYFCAKIYMSVFMPISDCFDQPCNIL